MTRIFSFNLYFYLVIVLSFYISQVLSNSTTIQKREINEESDGTLRIISRTLRSCGGSLVYSSFEATISTDGYTTYFLKGAIPGGLSQPTAQSTLATVNSSKVTCHYSPYTPSKVETACVIDSGSAITFYFGSYSVGGSMGVRASWEYNSTIVTNKLEMSFSLWSTDSVIQGCVIGLATASPTNSSSTTSIYSTTTQTFSIPNASGFQISYNALFAVIFILISGLTSYTLIKGNNIPQISKNLESSAVEKLAVDRSQPPSVYDIFRAAQFFVTTALLSLTHLPESYRDLISKFGWTIGFPSFSESLSNVVDNQIRKGICNMSNPPSSGFTTSGRIMNIPDYNLFFCVLIQFCIILAIALVITLLLGLISRLSKFLQKKWSIVKTAASNIHFLVLGGMFRVVSTIPSAPILLPFNPFCRLSTVISLRLLDLSHDRDAFNAPVHTFIYGALYTQYRDHSEEKQACLWFFVFTVTYDVIRAVATGGARQSGVVQTSYIGAAIYYYWNFITGSTPSIF
ncbi:7718_t:CDS:2 [Diversispora eburnea]|uniref:7718_t:CDS:1 n=1 Tax=Diversispora eburnea TaxID=1213867 RepID=A0A9N9BR33_9GLOM|nr:7718_t:CDS:2 [Diversispora eburnea]